MSTVQELYNKVSENVSKVIVGKKDVTDLLLIALISGGHVLLEDIPGTGKTKLVKTLAASVNCTSKRIQFTPDLLPSDITGVRYFNMKSSEFEFLPGPVFSNILLADEINRATPKTQAGLLECMEEKQATIDGTTYALRPPFMVIATQNPVENMGVFPLPEAQLDRFLFKTSMGYPTPEETVEILMRFGSDDPLETLKPVTNAQEILKARDELDKVFVHPDVCAYITRLTEATKKAEGVVLGISPRGALSLQKAAKGFAAISGRDYVIPDDVKKAAFPVLCHRLILSNSARVRKGSDVKIIEEILKTVSVPTESQIFSSKK